MGFRRPNALFIFLSVLFILCSRVGAIELSYKYKAGDKYRIVSTVNEDIYVDRLLCYRAEIINRISLEITGVSGGKARHSATFQTAEKAGLVDSMARNSEDIPFKWSRDYQSEFDQDELGYMSISDEYYMPLARDVPVFPGRELHPGDTWKADGSEVHDFRDSYGIEKPYRIPFTADYIYLGEREWKGTMYPAFSVSYRIFLEAEAVPGKVFPRRIQGASDQIIYWDIEHGQAASYEEYFRMILLLSDGQIWEYRGRAEAEVVEAPPMNKEELAKEIAGDIKDIEDASVRVSNEGIVISLENIQFIADSADLMPGERPKLDKIAEILMRYPDRDILVGGHTALSGITFAGTDAMMQQLSLERAGTVANYLIGKNVRTPDRVVIRGYGADRPVADNRTEAGMRKNRRVEIILLEN